MRCFYRSDTSPALIMQLKLHPSATPLTPTIHQIPMYAGIPMQVDAELPQLY